MSRVYEAVIVLLMLALLVIGTVWVADSLTLHVNSTSFYLMVILFGYNLIHSHLLLPLPPSFFLSLPPSSPSLPPSSSLSLLLGYQGSSVLYTRPVFLYVHDWSITDQLVHSCWLF